MISMIKRALLRRQIRVQDERLRMARDMLRYYSAMELDATTRMNHACNEFAHLQQLARLDRMARA
jgi:hypothetical protein